MLRGAAEPRQADVQRGQPGRGECPVRPQGVGRAGLGGAVTDEANHGGAVTEVVLDLQGVVKEYPGTPPVRVTTWKSR